MTNYAATHTLRFPVTGVDEVKIRICVDAPSVGYLIPDLLEDDRETYVVFVQGMADFLLREALDTHVRGVRYRVENVLGAAHAVEIAVRHPLGGEPKAKSGQVQALAHVCGQHANEALRKAFEFADPLQAFFPKAA